MPVACARGAHGNGGPRGSACARAADALDFLGDGPIGLPGLPATGRPADARRTAPGRPRPHARIERSTILRNHLFGAAALAAIASALPAAAQDYRAGDVAVGRPWTRAVAAGAPTAAGYMTLRNEGSAPDRLVSASTPMARAVELHEGAVADGITRMRPLPSGIEIPPGATVRLEPGGLHAMLTGPSGPFAQGTRVPLTLRFERAGEVTVELAVEAPGARSGGAHRGH